MEVIYNGLVYSLYAQLGLYDAEATDSYPEWQSGTEEVIFGPKGVAVATAEDIDVEVIVSCGSNTPEGILCGSGEITVGSQGLIVGNEIASSFESFLGHQEIHVLKYM